MATEIFSLLFDYIKVIVSCMKPAANVKDPEIVCICAPVFMGVATPESTRIIALLMTLTPARQLPLLYKPNYRKYRNLTSLEILR